MANRHHHRQVKSAKWCRAGSSAAALVRLILK
jgi:hypothetical protein